MTDQERNWGDEEMGSLKLGDERLEKRVRKIISDFSQNPTASIPEFCGDRAATQATYNLLSQKNLKAQAIPAAQRQATVHRIEQGGYQLILAVQDTTEFNYSHHPATTGLGALDHPSYQGFFTHTTLAVTPEGLPLGLLAQESWVRDKPQPDQEPARAARPIEQKESYKWFKGLDQGTANFPAGVSVLTISDQESDIFEYFVHPRPPQVDVLIRAWRERQVEAEVSSLWATIQSSPVRGRVEVEVTATPKRVGRTARCQVYYKQVTLKPPRKRPGLPPDLKPVTLWAVLIQEMNAPKGTKAIEWLLLTTWHIASFEQACQLIEFYSRRWLIERFHFVLKSGCALEQRQLKKEFRLERFLLLANVVAWRLLWLTYLGRINPDLPCSVALDPAEWQALYCFIHKTPLVPQQPPSIHQALSWIAQLGGFLGRKSDGSPGVKVLWRGWRRLFDITQAWLIFNSS
ncbi:MAG: IS4 family transposase [Anaerolineales bacterium]|nr:IS4 family transposase [Anaerolineales bacterium]